MSPATPRTEPTLELREVSKFFGDKAALKNVALTLKPGDSVFLYGPNGAGKTTLLRILASLARATSGAMLFNGESAERSPERVKAAVGFASHQMFLYGELTVEENLRFFGRLFGVRGIEDRIHSVLGLFDLRDRKAVRVRDLSRGLQQRTSLARALLHDPTFLLLDEPFAGLDAKSVARLAELLRRFPSEGKALLFSTHDFDQGAALAKRLMALDAGWLKYNGPLAVAPLKDLGIAQAPA